jgi:nucleotide-binding universal stress UspA family protein
MTWKTIVVGYQRDHASNRALERAADLATKHDSSLVVTSIAHLLKGGASSKGIGPYDPADPPEEHRAELEHARELLTDKGVKAEYDLELGDPADAIVALAERRKADLIVVGTHERKLVDRLLHGSVSGDVSKHAHCDVLIVH